MTTTATTAPADLPAADAPAAAIPSALPPTVEETLAHALRAIEGFQSEATAAAERIYALSGENIALRADLDTARAEALALRASAESTSAAAARLLAGVGHRLLPLTPGAEATPATPAATAQTLLEQYNALTDPAARTAFLRAHGAALLAAAAKA